MGRGKYRTSLAHLLIEKVKVGEITAYDETPEDYFTVIKVQLMNFCENVRQGVFLSKL